MRACAASRRYRYNNVPFDVGGRYIYLRDDDSDEFWSPSWQPTQSDILEYTCRHGMGYTTIGSSYKGIAAHTRYFVPLDENLEIWQLTVTNHRSTRATLKGFASIEFCLWDAQDDATNFQRNFQHRPGGDRRRRHLPQDRVSRAPQSFRLVRLLRADPLRYAARSFSRPLSRLGSPEDG